MFKYSNKFGPGSWFWLLGAAVVIASLLNDSASDIVDAFITCGCGCHGYNGFEIFLAGFAHFERRKSQ